MIQYIMYQLRSDRSRNEEETDGKGEMERNKRDDKRDDIIWIRKVVWRIRTFTEVQRDPRE